MSSRRNRGGGGGHGDGGEERWLLPYADMITLLLGLFIVLFAMSSINAKQFDNVRRSLSQTFKGSVLEEAGGVLPGSSGTLDPTAANQDPDATVLARLQQASNATDSRFDAEAKRLESVSKQSSMGNDVEITRNERGITVRLAGDSLFDSGSSELKPDVRTQLEKIVLEMKAFGSPIEIEGHTDGQPFDGEWGNWGLSSDRANEVVKFFVQRGFPGEKLRSVGHADTKPLVKPSSPNDANARNRRIEIHILEPSANDPRAEEAVRAAAARSAAERAAKAATPPSAARPTTARTDAVATQLQTEVDEGIVAQLADTSKAVN